MGKVTSASRYNLLSDQLRVVRGLGLEVTVREPEINRVRDAGHASLINLECVRA
jgi:hypothetical protein